MDVVPSKRQMLAQRLYNVGPPSAWLARDYINLGTTTHINPFSARTEFGRQN